MAQEQLKATVEVQALLDQALQARLQGRLDEAATLYDRALAQALARKDRKGETEALRGRGNVHQFAGQLQKALDLYRQAVDVARAIGDTSGEARALSNAGIAYKDTGQSRRALEVQNQALSLYQRVGNARGEASVRNNLGSVYLNIGQYQNAVDAYQQALSINRRVGDRDGEASALTNLGIVYSDLGERTKALEALDLALPLHRQTGNRAYEAHTLNAIGLVYVASRQLPQALDALQQALPIYRQIGGWAQAASILTNMGVVYTQTGQNPKALEAYHQALPLHRRSGNQQDEAKTLAHMGLTEVNLDHLAAAEGYYAQAIGLLEAQRSDLEGLSESKSTFLASMLGFYYSYFVVLLLRGKTVAALEHAQKTKARSLLDLMAAGRVDLRRELTPQERQQERQLRQKADALNRQMVKEGVENEVGAKKRYAALKEELTRAERQLQAFTDTLYARYPRLSRKQAARTARLADIARALPGDTALLEYLVPTPDKLALFVVHRGAVHVHILPVAYQALSEKAAAFRAACADPRQDYREAAYDLYQTLLEPAAEHFAGVKRLVVCPDGALWDIPFQALLNGRGQFLAERHEIAYAYSATGAVASLTAKAGRKKPTGTLLALANPDFGSAKRFGDLEGVPGQRPIDSPSRPIDSPSRPIDSPSRPIDSPSRPIDSPSRPIDSPSRPLDSPSRPLDSPSRAFDAVSRGGAIVSLPGTQREADALRRLFPGSAVLTGKAAQESQAKQAMGRYRYLHFATHGVVNDASPMLSSLVLAQPEKGGKDDGFLTAREIFEMDLSAEMVVLSACNTARGVQRTGDGIIGLTWALFAAGCPTQIVSQWAVDDASTATLMQRFYANLVKGKQGKGAALRQASLSLMQSPKHKHPYYWAPFVLVGDWR